MRTFRSPWKGAEMPNPACGGTEANRCVKPGWIGSPEPKHTRQDGALGNWMDRMTNRNQSVTHPALIGTGTHVCLRVSHGEWLSSFLEPFGPGCFSMLAAEGQGCSSFQQHLSMPTGRRDRMGDRPASHPIVVSSSEPGNLRCRPLRRMGQPASDVASQGRRSRSSPRAGKPSTWRRAPVWTRSSDEIAKHDMRNHHAKHS